jgi:hypothetical protein
MDKRSGRKVFWLGLLLYAASFFLSCVGGRGVFTPKPPSGADCAVDSFFFPWIYVHHHSVGSFLTDAPIENVSIAISGWINPVFFLAVLFQVIGKTLELTRILRNVILLMFPFCWIVFLHRHVYPREGYFLWIGGMLLVLFSSELENRRSATECVELKIRRKSLCLGRVRNSNSCVVT